MWGSVKHILRELDVCAFERIDMWEKRIGTYTSPLHAALDVVERVQCGDCAHRETMQECYEPDLDGDYSCLGFEEQPYTSFVDEGLR